MAEVVNYVDTDVVGGLGDGSSWANAYATLTDCENGEDSNLVTATNWMHIIVSGSTADTVLVSVSGWTTSSDYYILIEAADETDHIDRATASSWDVSRYHLSTTDTNAFDVREDYVYIDGIQMEANYTATANKKTIQYQLISATNNELRLSNCRIRCSTDATGSYSCVAVQDTDIIFKMWNCIVGPGRLEGILLAGGTAGIYNCTIYGMGVDGIESDAGTNDVYNCAVFNTGDDFDGDTVAFNTIDHCASDDNEGTNNIAESGGGANWPSDFTDAANGNFTLISSSNLVGTASVDPAHPLFDDDIAGTIRGAAWDVGAFEYVSGEQPGSIIPTVNYYMRLIRTHG